MVDRELQSSPQMPGQELEPEVLDLSLERLVDAAENRNQIIDIHEASGVRLRLNPNISPTAVSRVCLEIIRNDEDTFISETFIRLPGSQGTGDKLIPMAEGPEFDKDVANDLEKWLIDVSRYDIEREPFSPTHPADIRVAEQLTGSLLVAYDNPTLAGKPSITTYLLRSDVELDDLDNLPLLLGNDLLDSRLLQRYKRDSASPDRLVEHVYSPARYRITGASQSREISPSTLAIIDAGIQFAQLTGFDTISLAMVLATIYNPDNFIQDNFETGEYSSEYHMRISGEGVLMQILENWKMDMGLPEDEVMDDLDILDQLAIRQVNLAYLVEEYGYLTTVGLVDESSPPLGQQLPAMLEKAELSAVDLLQSLGEVDRQNVKNYARVIAEALDVTADMDQMSPDEIIEYLAEIGIISADVARVHSAELTNLIRQYDTLARARTTMQEAGIDTASIERTFEAKLLEFVVQNANAIHRTQTLSPELAVNLDALLNIVERTGLKGRSLKDVAQIIGRVITAQEQVVNSAFPALVKAVRQSVAQDLGIRLVSGSADRTGATLLVATPEEAVTVESHIRKLFADAGISDNIIPVRTGYMQPNLEVQIGNHDQRNTIPEKDWLPKGPDFYTKTRGH